MKNSKRKDVNQPVPPAPGVAGEGPVEQQTPPGGRQVSKPSGEGGLQPAGTGVGGSPGEGATKPPGGGKGGDPNRGSYDKSQKILLGLAVAILLLLIAGSVFALGYYMGRQDAGIRTLVDDSRGGRFPEGGPPGDPRGEPGVGIPGGPGEGEAPGRQQVKERIEQQLQDEDTELIKGEVTAFDGSNITVQALHGSETMTVTDETRFLGGGPGEAGGGQDAASLVAPGARVTLLVRKGDGEKLEVLAVRVVEQEPEPAR